MIAKPIHHLRFGHIQNIENIPQNIYTSGQVSTRMVLSDLCERRDNIRIQLVTNKNIVHSPLNLNLGRRKISRWDPMSWWQVYPITT